MTTKGVLSGWHNISTNKSMNIDGISVQDILGIISSIKQKIQFLTWKDLIDHLFVHISNKENPHQLTPEQMATTVIQLVYEAWLLEGYSGSMSEFIDMLFRYLEYADDTIMSEGVSEAHIPSVDVFAKYIQTHNDDANSHRNKFDPFFVGNEIISDPSRSFRQIVGLMESEESLLNDESGHYEKIFLQNSWATKEMTFVLSFRFEDSTVFQFENANGTVVLRITSQPDQQRILFSRCVADNLNNPIDTSIGQSLLTIPGVTLDHVAIPHNQPVVKCAIVIDGAKVSYWVFNRSFDVTMDTNSIAVNVDIDGSTVPVEISQAPAPFKYPRISFSRMHYGDLLTDLLYYPEALNFDQLLHVYEWIDGNIRELLGVDYGNPEVVIIPTDPIIVPTTMPVVFLLSGTDGLLNGRSSDGLVSVDEHANLSIDIVASVKTIENTIVVASNGQLYIKRQNEEEFSTSFVVKYYEEDVTIEGMYLFEDKLFFHGRTLANTYCIIYCPSDLNENNFSMVLECNERINSMAYGALPTWPAPQKFVVAAANNQKIYFQTISNLDDGNYFESTTAPEGPNGEWDILSVAAGNRIFVFGGTKGTLITWDQEYIQYGPGPEVRGDEFTIWTHMVFQDPYFLAMTDSGRIVKSIIPSTMEEFENYSFVRWGDVDDSLKDSGVFDITDVVSDFDVIGAVDHTGKLLLSQSGYDWQTPIIVSESQNLTDIFSRPREVVKPNLAFISNENKLGLFSQLIFPSFMSANLTQEWEHFIPGNGTNCIAASRFGGHVSFTTDLINWQEAETIIPGDCKFCKFVNGQFLYFNSNGQLFVSTDGNMWTLLTTIEEYEEDPWAWHLTAFASNGTNKHLIVYKNHVFTSTNLIDWIKTYRSSDLWQSAAYHSANSRFVIGSTNGKCCTSQDLVVWSSIATVNSSDSFTGIESNGELLAMYSPWRNRIYQSYDGSYWWSSYIDGGYFQGVKLVWYNDYFVVIDYYNASSTSNMASDQDWTTVFYEDFMTNWDDFLADIKYIDGKFYILTKIGNIYTYTPNAPSWEFITNCETPVLWKNIVPQRIYGSSEEYSQLLVCGTKGAFAYMSTDFYCDPYTTSEIHTWIGGMYCKLDDWYSHRRWVIISNDGTVAIALPEEDEDVASFELFHTYENFPCLDCSTNSSVDNPLNLIISSDGKYIWFDGEFSVTPSVLTSKSLIGTIWHNGYFYILTSDGFIFSCGDDKIWSAPVFTNCPAPKDFVVFNDKIVVLDNSNQISIFDFEKTSWSDLISVDLSSESTWIGITKWKDFSVLYSAEGYLALSMTGLFWQELHYPDSSINFMHAIGVTNPYSSGNSGEPPV